MAAADAHAPGPHPATATARRGVSREGVTTQYATSANLAARASIYRFQEPAGDLVGDVLDLVDWPPGARAVDLGCGAGPYLQRLTGRADVDAVGLDLSEGMAVEARQASGAPTVVGDIESLPFPDGSVDRVLAPHVLYHCARLERAVAELRRIVAPSGVALVVTNGADHLSRFRDLRRQGIGADPGLIFDRFTLELAEPLLRRHFEEVTVHHRRGTLVVPTVEPVLAYVDSARDLFEPGLPPGTTWDRVRATVEAHVAAEIAEHGAFRCPVHSGTLVCR
jgi:SAM-dependent methyltransferase